MNPGVSDGTNSLVQEGLQCEIVVRRAMTSCQEGGQTETTDSDSTVTMDDVQKVKCTQRTE